MKRLKLSGLLMAGSLTAIAGCAQAPWRADPHYPDAVQQNRDARELDEGIEGNDVELSPPTEELGETDGPVLQTGHSEAEPPAVPADSAATGEDAESEQQPPVLTSDLTLADLEQIALENNPTLRQAYQLVQQAKGNWLQVGLYPNPVVGYEAQQIGDQGKAGQQGGFLAQQIVTADKLDWNRTIAARGIDQAGWQAEVQRVRVVTGVQVGYYQLLGTQATVDALEQLQHLLAQAVTTAESLVRGGQSPRTDVLQAQIELNTVSLALQNARHREDAARRQLASAVGLAELPPGRLSGTLDGQIVQLDFEQEWEHLKAASPVLQVARAQVEKARAQLRREEVQPIPDLDTRTGVYDDAATGYTVVNFELGVMLPIHNRNQGNISSAMAALKQAAEEIPRLELLLRQRLADAFRRYEVARSQVEMYENSILPAAEENLRLASSGYEQGELDFLRILTARRSLVETEVNSVAARAELRSVEAEIAGLLLTDGLESPAEMPSLIGNGGSSASGGNEPTQLTVTPKAQ